MTQTKPAPRIAITYCSMCNWMLRSAWLGQELLVRDRLDPERSLGHVDGHTMSAEAES